MTQKTKQPRSNDWGVADCPYDYCMHYSQTRRRCKRSRCAYDHRNKERPYNRKSLRRMEFYDEQDDFY